MRGIHRQATDSFRIEHAYHVVARVRQPLIGNVHMGNTIDSLYISLDRLVVQQEPPFGHSASFVDDANTPAMRKHSQFEAAERTPGCGRDAQGIQTWPETGDVPVAPAQAGPGAAPSWGRKS